MEVSSRDVYDLLKFFHNDTTFFCHHVKIRIWPHFLYKFWSKQCCFWKTHLLFPTHFEWEIKKKKRSRSILDFDPKYRKVTSTNPSHLEAHAGFFRLLMKGIFDPYVLWPFDKKLIFLISNVGLNKRLYGM